MDRRFRAGAALAVAAALLVAACARQNAHGVATAAAGGTQSIDIDVVNDAFRPWVIQARLGQPLVVRLHNKGLTAHTFTVFDTGTDVVLARGESRTVTVPSPVQATSFRFVCRFHDAGGMHGGISFGQTGPERLAPP